MFAAFLSKDSPERKLILFFVKLFLIWVSWKIIINILGTESDPIEETMFPAISRPWQSFNYFLAKHLLILSKDILEFLGYTAYAEGRRIWIPGSGGIGFGNYCIGLQLIYYYVLLVLITPISGTRKAIGIPVGILITFLLNLVRISSLCLISLYAPDMMKYAHDHVFNVVVFGSMMWFYYYLTRENDPSEGGSVG